MSANAFDGTTGVGVGSGAFAFERSAMLQGQTARVVFFDESSTSGIPGFPYYGQLPSDLDGLRPPFPDCAFASHRPREAELGHKRK